MKKADVKRAFQTIEADDSAGLCAVLDADPDALECVGFHNRNVRDKTPLMYAMQCGNLKLANLLLDRGASAVAVMPGGPRSCVLSLCMKFAHSIPNRYDEWIPFTNRLLDAGANPNTGLWPALHAFNKFVDRTELIRLMLDRGADPDRLVGNSGNTVRELVSVNRHIYTNQVLSLFGIE